MRFRKRKIPQVNSSASADIAFLILIFFLVTSSMDPKTGFYRRLNPPVSEDAIKERIDIEEKNLLVFTIDADNQIIYNNKEIIALSEVKSLSKRFIINADIPQHTISLEVDRKASYQSYISMLNELILSYNELRNELALRDFNKAFGQLSPEQQEEIRSVYPFRIFEHTDDTD
jgi:biopolymer transport protein ExbD